MDYDKLIERLHKEAYGSDIEELLLEAATALSTLQAENAQLRESRDHWKRLAHELSEGVNGEDDEHERLQAENEKLRAELECVTAERNAAQALLAERSGVTGSAPITTAFGIPLERIRELVEADEWIDPAVELPPNDDMVLAIVSGKPADNILLEDAYELASYGSEGWIVEQYELWETPTVTWWRPLPDPPEKKKEER